jgi:hypothetical protein
MLSWHPFFGSVLRGFESSFLPDDLVNAVAIALKSGTLSVDKLFRRIPAER